MTIAKKYDIVGFDQSTKEFIEMLGQSNAGRLTTTLLLYLPVFWLVFNLSLGLPAIKVENVAVTTAPVVMVGAMVIWLSAFAAGAHKAGIDKTSFYKNSRFWLQFTAATVTANAIIAAQFIEFGALGAAISTAWEYGRSPVGLALLTLIVVGKTAYFKLCEDEEPFLEIVGVVLTISIVSTILFAKADWWVLVAVVMTGATIFLANLGEEDEESESAGTLAARRIGNS